MHVRTSWIFAFLAFFALVTVACSKSEDKKADDKKAEQTAGTPETPAGEKPSAAFQAAMQPLMAHYEAIRVALVKDEVEPATNAAKELKGTVPMVKEHASEAAAAQLDQIAEQAGALANAGDIDKMRLAYGEISRHIMAMMQTMPDMAKGYHVFECPMAKGYKMWLQTDDNLANPYMGTSMPECGSMVGMGPQGMMKGQGGE